MLPSTNWVVRFVSLGLDTKYQRYHLSGMPTIALRVLTKACLLTTHHSSLTAYYSPLTHYSPLTTHRLLLPTYYYAGFLTLQSVVDEYAFALGGEQ